MALEKYIIPTEGKRIPLHLFIAIISEVRKGNKTQADAKLAIETYIEEELTTDESTDFESIFAYIDGGASDSDKSDRSDEVYRVMSLAEHGVWFGTQELLKARMGWI